MNCEFVHVVISNNAFASWHNRALWLVWLILIKAKLSSRPTGQRSTLWADHRGSVTSSFAFLACRVTPDLQSDVVPRPRLCDCVNRLYFSGAYASVASLSGVAFWLWSFAFLSLFSDPALLRHVRNEAFYIQPWFRVNCSVRSCMIAAFASALLFCSLPWCPASELVLLWYRAFGNVLRGFLCLLRLLLGGNRIRFCCLVVRRCLCFHLPHLAGLAGPAVRRVRRCFLVFVLLARAWLASRLQLCWAPGCVSETRTSSLFLFCRCRPCLPKLDLFPPMLVSRPPLLHPLWGPLWLLGRRLQPVRPVLPAAHLWPPGVSVRPSASTANLTKSASCSRLSQQGAQAFAGLGITPIPDEL